MDVQAVGSAASALLGAYLARLGGRALDQAVDETNEAGVNVIRRIYRAVRDAMKGDAYSEATLRRLEHDPESHMKREVLAERLGELMQENDRLAAALSHLVEQYKAVSEGGGPGIVNIGGTTTLFGTNVAGRDLRIEHQDLRRPDRDDL